MHQSPELQTPHFKLQTSYFYILAAFWVACGVSLLMWGYEGSFLKWNIGLQNGLGDIVMPHLTHIGEGVTVSAILVLLGYRKAPALMLSLGIAIVLMLAVTSFMKHIMFDDWGRPLAVFGETGTDFHFVALRRWLGHSFPSGHSAAATLVMAFWAVFLGKNGKIWVVLTAIVAILACYSRTYIGLHFVGDILVGSLIGALVAYFVLRLIYPKIKNIIKNLSLSNIKVLKYLLLTMAITALVLSLSFLAKKQYGFAVLEVFGL